MKKARLEIRINEEDKEYLRKVAELEGCTITQVLDDYIQECIQRLKSINKLAITGIKPTDSEL